LSKKQIVILFICCLAVWTVGSGQLPLLPVYAIHLGADPTGAGLYLAFAYLALAAGALAAGWVSDRFQNRKFPIIIVGLVAVPLTWLMGQVTGIFGLSVLTAILWFCGGLQLALVEILTGLSAEEGQRGMIFGILSITVGLGELLGGVSAGYMVEHWGYSGMFTGLALFFFLSPLAAFFLTETKAVQAQEESQAGDAHGLSVGFNLLLIASVIGSISGFIVVLVRSLLMNDLGFGAMAISSTGAIGGFVTLPLPFLAGWLSDRTDRKSFLYIGYLAGLASVCALAFSTTLWHFWLVVVLGAFSGAVIAPIGSAMVTDLLSPQALGKGLALYGAAGWVGGVIGFAGAGYALETLGTTITMVIGFFLALVAIVVLIPVRSRTRPVETTFGTTTN
jgi:MFS family permease